MTASTVQVVFQLARLINYTNTIFQNLTSNTYAGHLSPEIDALWSTLLAPMHSRVSGVELQRDNKESTMLLEGCYAVELLGLLPPYPYESGSRAFGTPSRYGDSLSFPARALCAMLLALAPPKDHCLEMLRQSGVCHTPYDFQVPPYEALADVQR